MTLIAIQAVRERPASIVLEPISKLATQPNYFVVSSLAPRCTSMYYLGARSGPSRTRAARPILRNVLEGRRATRDRRNGRAFYRAGACGRVMITATIDR